MLSEDSAVAGRWPEVILERLCGPNVIAVEGDLLTAERRDMGKQIIADRGASSKRAKIYCSVLYAMLTRQLVTDLSGM